MKTELVRVCGIYYQVQFTEDADGDPQIVKVDFLGEDGLPASSWRFSGNWDAMLAPDHVDAIFMAVKDGNFVRTIKS